MFIQQGTRYTCTLLASIFLARSHRSQYHVTSQCVLMLAMYDSHGYRARMHKKPGNVLGHTVLGSEPVALPCNPPAGLLHEQNTGLGT
ncbi:hypothetical protein BKA83DRAFT_4409629 [Pisolithus microcarpus]|nr:hypothetical protein BKA83DRAFT_4409629 [Pisolithus microcarpus]